MNVDFHNIEFRILASKIFTAILRVIFIELSFQNREFKILEANIHKS